MLFCSFVPFYSDNGRTGTVFDRPAWNRLMDDVRTGKIQCIVVRDLSRFGRDYVESGGERRCLLFDFCHRLGLCFSALSCHFLSPSQPTAGSGQSL